MTWGHLIAFVIGTWAGILVMCLLTISKDGDQEGYRE